MTEIYDSNGTLITVGARIVTGDGFEIGTVTALTEPDGDADSEGRPRSYGPFVFVQYDDDGQTERWTATWNATGPWDDHRTDYTCDDVTVAVKRDDSFSAGVQYAAEVFLHTATYAQGRERLAQEGLLGSDSDARRGEGAVREPDGQRMEGGRIVPTDR